MKYLELKQTSNLCLKIIVIVVFKLFKKLQAQIFKRVWSDE